MLVIKWNSTPEVRHTATFVKSLVVGVRVVVDTYDGPGQEPCRVETGTKDEILAVLLDPAGPYRLAPMIATTLRSTVDDILKVDLDYEFDCLPNPDNELGDEPVIPVVRPVANVHPIFKPILGAIAPRGSMYHSGSAA